MSEQAMDYRFEAWLMGCKGENAGTLERLALEAVRDVAGWRRELFPRDPAHITRRIKESFEFRDAVERLEEEFAALLAYLKKSVPAFSPRYQAHMGWDLLLPGLLGYWAGMLHGSSNVAFEGGPATTVLEALAAYDLCRMVGYAPARKERPWGSADIRPWGHLCGGGTLANTEALWAARNLKYLPTAIRKAMAGCRQEPKARGAMRRKLAEAEMLPVPYRRPGDERGQIPFGELSDWELLNIPIDEALELPRRIGEVLDSSRDAGARQRFENAVNAHGINVKGVAAFAGISGRERMPRIFVPGTRHYSFEKAAGLLGLGQGSLRNVFVDRYARLDLQSLKDELEQCLEQRIPVIAVVAVMGSTEEAAVDPLDDMLALRAEFRRKGMEFAVHADAAWGGYHASLVRPDFAMDWMFPGKAGKHDPEGRAVPDDGAAACATPSLGLSEYVRRQYLALSQADSVTVDPHKQGHVPFPAGAVCYRNSALRDLLKFSAPYLGEIIPQGIAQVGEKADQHVGIYGVEGSRPGAAAASVFLTHRLVRPSQGGYGKLIGMELFNCKRIYASLSGMNDGQDEFIAVPLADPGGWEEKCREVEDLDNAEIARRPDLLRAMEAMGPDLNVLCYLFNFRNGGGCNQDIGLLNGFNRSIYNQIRLDPEDYPAKNLIVSMTLLFGEGYGPKFFSALLKRLGLREPEETADRPGLKLVALRSTEANPWLSDAEGGSRVPHFREAMAEAVRRALQEISLAGKIIAKLKEEGFPLERYPDLATLLVEPASLKGIVKEAMQGGLTLKKRGKPCSLMVRKLLKPGKGAPEKDDLARSALRHFDDKAVRKIDLRLI